MSLRSSSILRLRISVSYKKLVNAHVYVKKGPGKTAPLVASTFVTIVLPFGEIYVVIKMMGKQKRLRQAWFGLRGTNSFENVIYINECWLLHPMGIRGINYIAFAIGPFLGGPSLLASLASLARPLRLRECDERGSICRRAQEGIDSKGPRRHPRACICIRHASVCTRMPPYASFTPPSANVQHIFSANRTTQQTQY